MKKIISVTFLLASDDRTSAAKDSFVSEMSRDHDVSEKRCVTPIKNDSIGVISTLMMKLFFIEPHQKISLPIPYI
ncbi:hypothetical protein ACU60U_24815 [Klebsiella aerogenes]